MLASCFRISAMNFAWNSWWVCTTQLTLHTFRSVLSGLAGGLSQHPTGTELGRNAEAAVHLFLSLSISLSLSLSLYLSLWYKRPLPLLPLRCQLLQPTSFKQRSQLQRLHHKYLAQTCSNKHEAANGGLLWKLRCGTCRAGAVQLVKKNVDVDAVVSWGLLRFCCVHHPNSLPSNVIHCL